MSSASHSDKKRKESCRSIDINKEYKCRLCHKIFASGHGLAGHQNAHRSVRQQLVTRIIKSIKPRKISLAIRPPVAGNGTYLGPVPGTRPELMIRPMGGLWHGTRAIDVADHQYRPYARAVREEARKKSLTKVLIGKRWPMRVAGGGADMEATSARTKVHSSVGESMGVEDGVEVSSKGKEVLDLDLKLWF
ncbi:hypothetical protein CFOL_v3_07502 [Cephalotus follicularis]|uniref:C2H2-type domain-containing protein n=1 Tax=Cephalotus follicularis TaxID=3775 RepID=A0A1Q3B805_CEPFO|nr:hypothetical protein CFOL_v3_07502 [Cephalotus follicularis]